CGTGLRETIATLAPSTASWRAIARPIPDEPPVTRAFLPPRRSGRLVVVVLIVPPRVRSGRCGGRALRVRRGARWPRGRSRRALLDGDGRDLDLEALEPQTRRADDRRR